MLSAIDKLPRYIVCSRVTKRPIFVFVSSAYHPNDALAVFPYADDYSFGILQSDFHWQWFIARCSTLKGDFRYTSNTVFDSFPWPQKPTASQVKAVASAAQKLRSVCDDLMTKTEGTLRDIYRTMEKPGKSPLRAAHDALNVVVRTAYGASAKADAKPFLFQLNKALAAQEAKGGKIVGPGLPQSVKDSSAVISSDALTP